MRLWNRDMTIGMTTPHNPQWLGKAFNHAKPKRVYNTLVMLVHLLDRISPRSQWRQHLLALFDEHSVVDFSAMGFPADWRSSVIWEARS